MFKKSETNFQGKYTQTQSIFEQKSRIRILLLITIVKKKKQFHSKLSSDFVNKFKNNEEFLTKHSTDLKCNNITRRDGSGQHPHPNSTELDSPYLGM